MKVFNGRVQLVTFLILSITSNYYAIAAAEQRLRQQPQQELQQAEVNVGQKSSQKIIFGTKTATITRLYDKASNETRAPAAATSTRQRNAANNRGAAATTAATNAAKPATSAAAITSNVQRISRRFDSHQQSPPPAQLIAQHEIPIVHKDLATKAAVAGANATHKGPQQQQQQRSRNHQRQRSEAAQRSSSAAQTPPLQASSRSTNRARFVKASNSNVNPPNLNISQTKGSSLQARSRSSPRAKKSTTSTTTTTSSTTTQRPTYSRNFQQNNPFNFIPQNFWSLSAPPATTVAPLPPAPPTATSSKKLPKKYKSPIPVTPTPFDDKLIYQKPAHLSTVDTPNVPKPHSNDGPFRIALPTLNFNPPTTATKQDGAKEKGKRATVQPLRERFNCPRESEVRFQLFPKICKTDKDCSVWNRDELCCEIFGAKSCVNGMPKPLEETSHMPILGLIPRKCPTRPLAELWWDVKECDSDNDCWPRVCCPDGRRRYCRTSEPELEVVPVPVKRSFNYLTEYLECTAPPPPIFDLHPKACTSTFDCFPNVCCQEAGLRHCRPPKKSVLTLMANFLNVDFVKRLTQNIVIK